MSKLTFLPLIWIFINNVFSQTYITRNEALEDIDYFFRQAEQIHPDLYFKVSKTDMQTKILDLKKSVKDSISIDEFSKKLSAVVNLIGDAHTNIGISKHLRKKYYREKTRLPFGVKISGNTFYVSKPETEKLKEGDIIVSVNNIKSNDFNKLTRYVVCDIESQKPKFLGKYFSYYFFIEYEISDSINITVNRNGKIITTQLTLNAYRKKPRGKYDFFRINDTVAVLKINSFANINKKHYKSFLDSIFNRLSDNKNLTTLVIDLKNNGGGTTSYAVMLFPYINVTTYRLHQKYEIKTGKAVKKYFGKRYIKWFMYPFYPFAYFSRMGRIYFFKKNGSITSIATKERRLKAKSNAFKGKVYVLTSAGTYSAAADFVYAFSYSKRGKIIGDTVGQPYTGYIDRIPVTLPNSKLRGGVSFKRYEYVGANENNKHQGISPDLYFDADNYKNEAELYDGLTSKIRNAGRLTP